MKRLDFWIMAIIFTGGVVSIFLQDMKPIPKVISREELVYKMTRQGKYVTTDQVAKMIMESDPSLLLIDVRSPEEYAKFSLDGAINVPVDKILDKQYKDYFNQDVYNAVLFSNGTSLADQAWMILVSNGYEGNLKVMKGGLNEWYLTILNPVKPQSVSLTKEEENTYLFRKGAQIYFTGMQVTGSASEKKSTKKVVKPVVKRKKKEVTGGCG